MRKLKRAFCIALSILMVFATVDLSALQVNAKESDEISTETEISDGNSESEESSGQEENSESEETSRQEEISEEEVVSEQEETTRAGETEGDARILFFLNAQQHVQNGGGVGIGYIQSVAQETPFPALFRVIAEYPYCARIA